MPQIPGALRRNLIPISIGLALGAGLVAACGSNPTSLYGNVSVTVTGHGTGNGTVYAPDPAVDIDCTFIAGTSALACHDDFDEAGAGGVFTLEATAAAGSHFDGFTGCSSVAGSVCTLSFAGNDTTFNVGVTFTLSDGAATNTVNLYNGAEISVYLVGPGEATTAGGLIAPHAERSIEIDTTVGSTDFFRAYNSAHTLIASVTCQVTADAWTGAGDPLVVLNATEGYFMTCDNGLVLAP
jgi:hypothetical protein